jgi:hypothetical protein
VDPFGVPDELKSYIIFHKVEGFEPWKRKEDESTFHLKAMATDFDKLDSHDPNPTLLPHQA